jgi:hypothetical protein
LEALARTRLTRFQVLTLVRFGVLRASGLETVPTVRSPHYTILLPNPEADLRILIACDNVVWMNQLLRGARGDSMNYAIDIDIDWNEEDDTGLPWTFAERAALPEKIVPGAYVLAGRGSAVAVALVVDRDESGVIHLRPMEGSIGRNAYLLAKPLPA